MKLVGNSAKEKVFDKVIHQSSQQAWSQVYNKVIYQVALKIEYTVSIQGWNQVRNHVLLFRSLQ